MSTPVFIITVSKHLNDRPTWHCRLINLIYKFKPGVGSLLWGMLQIKRKRYFVGNRNLEEITIKQKRYIIELMCNKKCSTVYTQAKKITFVIVFYIKA